MATLRLTTREARRKLRVRDRPYHHELRRGLWLAYRRGKTSGAWSIREHINGKFVKRRLGAADDDVPSDGVTVLTFAEAVAMALGEDRPTITRAARLYVREAWEEYAETRATPIDARERAMWARFIGPVLGDRPVSELATHEIERWLRYQVTKYGQRLDSGETDPRERDRRAKDTANRRLHLLKAVLNSAFHKHADKVVSDAAWRRVRPFARVDRPRVRVVGAAEAVRLINALDPGLRPLVRGSLFTGLRLGELLGLAVSDVADGEVHVRHSKSGRSRNVPLSEQGRVFFEQITAGKAGDAPVFAPVSRVALSRGMKAACVAARLSPPVRYHDMRRSYGSALINRGASLDAIRRLLGHSDSRQTEKTYAHLQQQVLRDTVNQLLPDFGSEPTNVAPLKRPRRSSSRKAP